jgi:hypothetical protein
VLAVSWVVGLLLYIVGPWGTPLHSDGNPTYRVETSSMPGLAEAIPPGLRVALIAPMPPWEACLENYRAYSRFSCGDILRGQLAAVLAGDRADGWRLFHFLFNIASVSLFVGVCRQLGTPVPVTLTLALSLLLVPYDVWTNYKSAETVATPFLMLSLWLALRGQHPGAAAAMFAAVFTKETFAVAWVAVGAVTLAREWKKGGAPSVLWRAFVPHLVALLALAAWVGGLKLTQQPRVDYVQPFLAWPDVGLFIERFGLALLPLLLRGYGLALVVVAGLALALMPGVGWTRYRQASLWIVVGGLLAAVMLHGAEYYLTRRFIVEHRYLLPANFLLMLALAALSAPLARLQVTPLVRRAGWVGLAATLGVLLYQPTHETVQRVGDERISQTIWRAYLDEVLARAPDRGHVLLRFGTANEIEHAWATEAHTLLAGRFDLTYHLEVQETAGTIWAFVQPLVDAYNVGRAPLPADGANVVVVRPRQAPVGNPPRGSFRVYDLIGPPAPAADLQRAPAR